MKEIIKMNLSVGNDNGNSEHDIIINGKLIKQPNVLAKVRALPNFDEVSEDAIIRNMENNLVATIDSQACDKCTYYIGEYARKSGKKLTNIEVGAFNSKLDSDIPVVNTLGQIAGYAVQKAIKEVPDLSELEVNVDMVTALPVTQFSKKNADIFSKKFTNGKHYVTLHISRREIKVIINFEFVKVLPESVPTVFYLQGIKEGDPVLSEFNQTYKINTDGKFFQNKKILHLAIGEGTTEYPLTEGMIYNLNFIEGSNNGVGHATERVINAFMKAKYLQKFTRQDYSDVLKNPAHKYHVPALEFIDPELENEADNVIRHAREELGKANNDVDIMAIYGGGSILMKKYLYDRAATLCQRAEAMLFYVPESEAVTIEAKGMYAFVKSSIFSKIKQAGLVQK